MKKLVIKTTLLFCIILFATDNAVAQLSPPPPPGQHGSSNNQTTGGDAPVGTGIGILLALGAAYGGKKVYNAYRNKQALEE